MLTELYIKNFALIDELKIEFNKGFNIITGETGSGKSIMIDALSLALGKKASKSVIREGKNKAIIEALFYVDNESVLEYLKDIGIDSDSNVVVSREISLDGRSVSRVNNRVINLTDLRKITETLITIHGQNEYEPFMTQTNQLKLLDSFGDKSISEAKNNYLLKYDDYLKYNSLLNEINNNMDEAYLERELDFLTYELKEIKNSNLKRNELNELKEKIALIENNENIKSTVEYVRGNIYSDNNSVIDVLYKCINKLEEVKDYLPKAEEWLNVINEAYYSLEDVSHSMNLNVVNVDEYDDLNELNSRLDKIIQIHKKYGSTYDDVIEYYKNAQNKRQSILKREENSKIYKEKINEIKLELTNLADELTKKRQEVADILKEEVKQEIHSLNMKNTSIDFDFIKTDLSKYGSDDIDIMVSFNKGENLKSLSKVASGGEMSRFMLAFKNVVAKFDNIDSLIFDEIDTGVSGVAAGMIGKKLKEISKFRQVICVTHLPQVASYAGTHFTVEKLLVEDRTITNVRELSFDERVLELSKMLSGEEYSETTLSVAKDLLNKNME